MLKITVIACGNKMPSWVNSATDEFAKRLQEYCHLNLIEIALEKRGKASDLARILDKEANHILAQLPPQARLIALEINGQPFSSEKLASKLDQLRQVESHICLLIGGPEGLAPQVLKLCHEQWSLSQLTLPHPIARVVLLEALYRSFSILNHHPYHK